MPWLVASGASWTRRIGWPGVEEAACLSEMPWQAEIAAASRKTTVGRVTEAFLMASLGTMAGIATVSLYGRRWPGEASVIAEIAEYRRWPADIARLAPRCWLVREHLYVQDFQVVNGHINCVVSDPFSVSIFNLQLRRHGTPSLRASKERAAAVLIFRQFPAGGCIHSDEGRFPSAPSWGL